MVPSSPSADTTSRPISLAMYSWVKDMSAERNMVSCAGAMVARRRDKACCEADLSHGGRRGRRGGDGDVVDGQPPVDHDAASQGHQWLGAWHASR